MSLVDIVRGLNILCARGWVYIEPEEPGGCFSPCRFEEGLRPMYACLPEEGSYWYRCICLGL